MRLFRTTLELLLVAALATTASAARSADEFPSKPIRLVVTLAPGGPLDLFARLVGENLQKQTGQPAIVENRPGAASRIAIDNMLQAPADGYTLLVGGGSIATLPVFVKGLNFDVLRDITPVTIGADAQQVVVVHASVPAKSVAEFVAYAKANPGKVNYGSLGRQPIMLAVEAFKRMAGIQMTEVPYKATPELLTGLARNDVQFLITSYELIAPQVAGGTARPLAVVGNLRLKSPSELPTMAELGYPGLRLPGWYAVFARANTPRPVVDTLYREIAKALQQPAVAAKIEATGSRVIALNPDQSRERLAAEVQFWAGIAKEVNLQPE
jgi:tripartite-type tricarboxylate transporter receptor subunit TctC